MPVRRVLANPAVKADQGRVALERGPLVYCAEGADNAGHVLDRLLARKLSFTTQRRSDLLSGIVTVTASSKEPSNALTCVPYYAWGNRGPNEMRVWFPMQ
jgi:DUF1680 family protein